MRGRRCGRRPNVDKGGALLESIFVGVFALTQPSSLKILSEGRHSSIAGSCRRRRAEQTKKWKAIVGPTPRRCFLGTVPPLSTAAPKKIGRKSADGHHEAEPRYNQAFKSGWSCGVSEIRCSSPQRRARPHPKSRSSPSPPDVLPAPNEPYLRKLSPVPGDNSEPKPDRRPLQSTG